MSVVVYQFTLTEAQREAALSALYARKEFFKLRHFVVDMQPKQKANAEAIRILSEHAVEVEPL